MSSTPQQPESTGVQRFWAMLIRGDEPAIEMKPHPAGPLVRFEDHQAELEKVREGRDEARGASEPDISPGDVIAAEPDGTIILDDGITTWNPARATAFLLANEKRRAEAAEKQLGEVRRLVERHQAELDAAALGDPDRRHRDDVDNDLYNALIGPNGLLATPGNEERPKCSTCEDEGQVAKNFGIDSPGRPEIVPCPDCSPAPGASEWPEVMLFGRCEQWGVEHIDSHVTRRAFEQETDVEFRRYVPALEGGSE